MNKKFLLAVGLMIIAVPAFAQEGIQNKARVGSESAVDIEVTQIRTEEKNRVQAEGDDSAQIRTEEQNRVNTKINATDTEDKDEPEDKENMGRGEERRSEVAKAVKELLAVADRDGGIGEKVREIAKNQEKDANDIEDTLKDLKNRGQFRKFLFGADYKKISDTEEMLKRHEERMAELNALLPTVKTTADRLLLEEKIRNMEEIRLEIQKEVTDSENVGFSLFGWLNRIINKK